MTPHGYTPECHHGPTAPRGSTQWIAQLRGRREAYRRWANQSLTRGAYEARMEEVRHIDQLLDEEGAA